MFKNNVFKVSVDTIEWCKATAVRAVKTMAQTAGGMIIAGSVSLVSAVALNYNEVTNKVANFLKDNSGLIVGISLALLVLGIILCCVGVVTPLSIGLIVVGAIVLVLAVIALFNSIVIVHQTEAYIVERIGKFHGILDVGLHMIIPFFDRVVKKVSLKLNHLVIN